MSLIKKITRRDILLAGGIGAASLGLSLYLRSRRERWEERKDGKFSPSVWLQIAPDNIVTIWVAKSEMGQGVRTSLAMLVAEELEADWPTIRVQQAPTRARYGEERTQGSTSVRTLWDTLRLAGATAREMLVTAAAQAWRADRNKCKAENGYVVHLPTGRLLSYGELSRTASEFEIPKRVSLKRREEFKLLGKPIRHLDARSKTDGSAVFGIDVKLPGMLYATILRSPTLGGRLKRFNAEKAQAIPGVHKVLQTASGVAAVADSSWTAMKARREIQAEWDAGTDRDFSQETWQKVFHNLEHRAGEVARNDGNVEEAIAASSKKMEAVYELPFLAHAAMEPLNCTADVRWNRCEVWCSTQSPATVQRRAASVALLPPDWVEVHTTLLGGGFGRRLENDMVDDAVKLSKATGRPVQVLWTREDDMRHDFYRPAAYNYLVGALDTAGKPSAWKHHIVSQSIDSRFGTHKGTDSNSVQGASDLPYAIPNVRVDCVAPQIPVPVGYWRSVGYALNAFATESFLDEMAAAAGKDPCAFRLDLLRNSPRRLNVLARAAEKADWRWPLHAGQGRGVALHTSYDTTVAQIVELSVGEDGSIRVKQVVCAIDCGQTVNPNTIEAQMQGGIVFGLSAALWGNITFEKGQVQQSNFDNYRVLRISEMPKVEVVIVPSLEPPTGVGEVGVPPIGPAVANAIFAATGIRIRRFPLEPELKRQKASK
jgi:isoquinoline 1-oxidoreductase subunit beta